MTRGSPFLISSLNKKGPMLLKLHRVCATVFLCSSLSLLAAEPTPRVDFSYAFGTPHRITVAPPDSGDKTLVDAEPGKITLSWSYDNLLSFPVANFFGPQTQWKLVFQPTVDGQKVEKSTWSRLEDWLPGLAAR